MLGDHYYSSCEADKTWKTSLSLVANTDPKTKQAKQYLDEHLVRVSDNAMRVAQALSRLADEMESAYDIQKLKRKVHKVLNGKIKLLKEFNSSFKNEE